MSIRVLALIAGAALLTASAPPAPPASAGSGLQGEWRNTKNTVHLRVQPCGKALCGTVIWAAEQQRADAKKGSGRDLIGSQLLRDLTPNGEGKWRGKVFVPDINASVSATILQLNPNTIRVSGCTLLGLACKTQHWHRLK